MPSLTTWAPFCPCGQCYPRDQISAWLLLSRLQGNKPHRNSPEPAEPCHQHAPELFGTLRAFRTLPPEPTPPCADTFRNLAQPASGTYIHRNFPEPSGTRFRNLHQHTPELSGTFRNPPPEPTPAYAGTFRNLPEPASGTCTGTPQNSLEPSGTHLPNLQHTPELSGTFRNTPPEPTPAHPRTLRNLPEPSSGTCSCDPHRHTPELIWADDPISLRCWGIKKQLHEQSWCQKKWSGTKGPHLFCRLRRALARRAWASSGNQRVT